MQEGESGPVREEMRQNQGPLMIPTGFCTSRFCSWAWGASQEIEQRPPVGAEIKCGPLAALLMLIFKESRPAGLSRVLYHLSPMRWKVCSRTMHKGTRHIGEGS